MSKRGVLELLSDMLESIKRIEEYTKNISLNDLLSNKMIQDAVVRNIEVIGEAAKGIPVDFKRKHPQVKWKEIAGMRDKVIHFYFGINWEIVWNTVKQDLPELRKKIRSFIKELK